MRLAKEGIIRSTRWASMRDSGRDHLPNWEVICAELFPDKDDQARLLTELCQFADRLKQAPRMAKEMGSPSELVDRAMARCAEIVDSVLAACS